MDDIPSKPSKLSWVKNHLIFSIIVFLIGLVVGYYFGYNTGFEKAAKILVN